jgi:hypothetical protein
MPPHDEEQMHARTFAVECYYTSGKVLAQAVHQFEKAWNEQHDNILRQIVVNYCTTKITPEGVKADCDRLKCLYRIIACPVDQYVEVTEPGHQHSSRVQGTGGGYPSKRWR